MIKKFAIAATVCFGIAASTINAQEKDAEVLKTKKDLLAVNTTFKKPSKDYVMIQAGFHTWQLPSSSTVSLSQRGHDLGMYLCYDFALAKENWSFAGGAGIGSSNVYFSKQRLPLTDTYSVATFLRDTTFKRHKLSCNYLEFPLELRYYANSANRNRGFKFAIGAKVGTLINAHTKTFTQSQYGNFRDKENSRRYFETWRILPMARIGYGNFSFYGTYQINELFKPVNTIATGIKPISIGLTISGL